MKTDYIVAGLALGAVFVIGDDPRTIAAAYLMIITAVIIKMTGKRRRT